MKKNENLDLYNESYHTDFKYNDENLIGLSFYGHCIKNEIKKNNSKSILSLGIGHQVVIDVLSNELNYSLENYDILEGSKIIIDNFKVAEEFKNKINVILTYFENYQTEKKYDIIEMGFVLEHVDDPEFIINKFKNLLSPSGKMFIAVPNATSLHRQIGFHAGYLPSLYELSEYDLKLGHKTYFDTEMLVKMIENSGLKVNNKTGIFLKPITTAQMNTLSWDENVMNALIKLGEKYPEISNSILIETSL